jgi:membrane protein DedA with SNARE-associated domain
MRRMLIEVLTDVGSVAILAWMIWVVGQSFGQRDFLIRDDSATIVWVIGAISILLTYVVAYAKRKSDPRANEDVSMRP